MAEMWIVLVQLPLMLILAFIFGYEPVLYMGVSLLGFIFWMFGEDVTLKRYAFTIFLIAEVLFISSTMFYFVQGDFTREDPFKLQFLFSIPFLNKYIK